MTPAAATFVVIDDDPDALQATRRMLEGEGYRVITGASAAEACELTHRHLPALLLLDVYLPDGNGREVARQLKTERALAGVFVILFSGTAITGEEQAAGLTEGLADGYIVQPLSKLEFLARIRAFLRLHQAQESLREAHLFNQQIITNAQEGIIVYGPDLRYQVWNPFMEHLTGFPASEVLGRHPLELFPFLKDGGVIGQLEQALGGESVGPRDFPFHVASTGRSGWASDFNGPLRNQAGEIIGVIGLVRDITSRKLAEWSRQEKADEFRSTEEARAQSSAQVRTLVNAIPDLVWLKDADGVYLACNPRFERFFGAKEKDIIGKSDHDFVDRALADAFRDNDRRAMAAGKPIPNEEIITFADDGHEEHIETIKAPVLGNDGVILGILGIGRDITSRKLAEASLQEKEFEFRSYVDNAPLGIFIADEQGRYLQVNPAASTITGYTREELLGMSIPDLLPAESLDVVAQGFQEMAETGRTSAEFEFRHKDRFIRWWSLEAVRLTPTRFLGMVTDITGRKQAEAAILASEHFTHAAIDALSAHLAILDEYGQILAVNRAWRDFARANAGQASRVMEGVNYFTVCDAAHGPGSEEAAPFAAGLRTVLQGAREEFSLEYPCHSPQAQRWFRASATRFLDQAGAPRLIVAHEDITERRLAMVDLQNLNGILDARVHERTLQLHQSMSALGRSEEQFRFLAESAPILIQTMDAKGGITYLNQTGLDFHGLASMEEARGFDWQARIHPEDRESLNPWCMDLAAPSILRTWEYRSVNRTGECRWLLSRAIREQDLLTQGWTIIGISIDITERKQHDEFLRILEGFRAKSQMAANIAHEINNPLAGINLSFQILARSFPKDHPDHPFVDIISRELERIAGIVRMAYSIHRPGPPQVRDANVHDTFADLAALLTSKLRTRKLVLHIPEPDPELQGRFHEDLLRQVLFNVIANAIDASKDGGRITCRASRDSRWLFVQVEDQGMGIPEADAQAIFENGFTTKDGPELGGLGAGLATCRSILLTIGGHISFHNLEPGPGACFEIAIPWQTLATS